MDYKNDDGRSTQTSTDLYLVRVWRRKSNDGVPRLRGKLQHVVSGASCYFDGLSNLPDALEKMMAEEPVSFGPDAGGQAGGGEADGSVTP